MAFLKSINNMKLRTIIPLLGLLISLNVSCELENKKDKSQAKIGLSKQIANDSTIALVEKKALEVVENGFNAGDGYMEVWIRDYNTFINLAAEVYEKELLKKNLKVFFRLQGEDGNIVDGFIPQKNAISKDGGYNYIFTDIESSYAGHKNTVETDQETSLVQTVYKYVKSTGDVAFLTEEIGGVSVAKRMEHSMDFLMNKRYNEKYGLLYGATTADWGDVQPEHEWGVYLTDDTHYAIDVYDNAMFIIALDNFLELAPEKKSKWEPIRESIAKNVMQYLWDEENDKFIPHIYLNGSPFPEAFDENKIYYHGGTAVAIEAGLLTEEQIEVSLKKMRDNVKKSGAHSIGLTLYPTYPHGSFQNTGMYPYGYQNGGDWTWFGGRMILALLKYGYYEEAYLHLKPMLNRVIANDGFYEWYTVGNEPMGSATFKGSAGVLYDAIYKLKKYK